MVGYCARNRGSSSLLDVGGLEIYFKNIGFSVYFCYMFLKIK
jgi:hypothetical protein